MLPDTRGGYTMSLYEDWNQLIESQASTPQQAQMFWDAYFAERDQMLWKNTGGKAKQDSRGIQRCGQELWDGKCSICGLFRRDQHQPWKGSGAESLEETTELDLTIDFEKLFLTCWRQRPSGCIRSNSGDGILSEERRKEIQKEWRASKQAVSEKTVGRNDPCPCGSGKKYKKCCGKHVE